MYNLENQVVLITGAGSGIGSFAARKFSELGAIVIAWDLKFPESYLPSVEKMTVNVTNLTDVENATHAIIEKYSRIDVLINNAGITRDATLQKMTSEQWQQVIDVNLTGVFNCTKAVSAQMIRQQSGRIISTSSVVAHNGNYGQTNYVASKSGVIGMTKVWAKELGKFGINVNAVAPGFIKTEMIETVPEKVIQKMTENSSLKRIGSPEDIANAYIFLSSSLSGFITGHILNVDGGLIV